MNWIVPLLSFKDEFGIKSDTNVDMPLNKETRLNQTIIRSITIRLPPEYTFNSIKLIHL